MSDREIQIGLGVGSILAAALIVLIVIPYGVSAPSNVPKIVLSPIFWPDTIAMMTAAVGIGLVLTGLSLPKIDTAQIDEGNDRAAAFKRLGILAVIMGLTLYAMPRLGLVWAMMLVFVSLSFLVRNKHQKAGLVCAVLVPLALYFFFAHVAGVAIPQGDFVRLP